MPFGLQEKVIVFSRKISSSLVLLIAVVSTFISTEITLASAPKSGMICKKPGITKVYQGNRYKCIKNGKKLVWSKGVALSQPSTPPVSSSSPTPSPSASTNPTPMPSSSPVPSPTPTPSPTPLEDWQKVRKEVQTKYAERIKVGRYFDFEFILSPTVNKLKAQETIDAYREASRYWTWLFDSTGTYSIVWVLLTEKDYDWWYAKVTELQGKNSIYPWDKKTNEFGHCGLSDQAFCGYGNTQEAPDGKMKLFQYNVIGSNFQGRPVPNVVHHESVHFYQLANNMTFPRDLPCWYIEGQATFYGNVISGTNDGNFERSRILNSLPNSRLWTSLEWDQFLKAIQNNHDECRKDSRNYSIGSFIWEYLLMNYSEEQLHKVHIALKTQTWAEVALTHLKKSAEQLNSEFANHLTTIFKRS